MNEKGCAWNMSACWEAAYQGHIECLKYLKESGCEWYTSFYFRLPFILPYFSFLSLLVHILVHRDAFLGQYAAWNGKLNCLRYALENGCVPDIRICQKAARGGHLECLRYCYLPTSPLSFLYIKLIPFVRYAREAGCEWDETVCALAATGGHLDCLKYVSQPSLWLYII